MPREYSIGLDPAHPGGVAIEPARPDTHAFVAHPWGHDSCDKKLDDSGRVRTCAVPAADPVHQVAPAKKGKKK